MNGSRTSYHSLFMVAFICLVICPVAHEINDIYSQGNHNYDFTIFCQLGKTNLEEESNITSKGNVKQESSVLIDKGFIEKNRLFKREPFIIPLSS